MKKIIFIATLVLALTGYAQKNQITFDNVLEYSLKSNNSESSKYSLSYYLDANRDFNLIESIYSSSNKDISILKSGKYIKVDAIGFDRTLLIDTEKSFMFPYMQTIGEFFSSNIVLEPMNKKGTFMGISCEFYSIKSDVLSESSLASENACLCVDTSNNVKNLKALLPSANIDGLILAYGHVDYPGEEFSLDAMRKVDIKIEFDFNAEYKKLEDAYNASQNETEIFDVVADTAYEATSSYYNDYYNDPLCNYYEYFQDLEENTRNYAYKFSTLGCDLSGMDSDYDGKPDLTRDQAIQIAKKQSQLMVKQGQKSKVISKEETKKLTKAFEKFFKEAEAFVPEIYESAVETVSAVDSVDEWGIVEAADYGYRNYSSDYKSIQVDQVSLAAETQLDYSIQNYMPNYCYELKKNVPDFKNENLKTHVYNLVGQICDLYLYQNGGSVDYFGTIDSMRKSILEIDNMRGELSKNDTKLLNDYLNSLD